MESASTLIGTSRRRAPGPQRVNRKPPTLVRRLIQMVLAKPQLAATLSAKLQQTSVRTVVIKADANVPYRHVVDVMDAASVVGAKITLAADLQQAMQQAR